MKLKCNTYLVHYEPLTERLDFMKKQLFRLGIEVNKIISSEPPAGWIKNDMDTIRKKLSFFQNNCPRHVTRQEESLAWKHFKFMTYAAESDVPSLVLEDDAVLNENFTDVINEILEKDNWDVIFPGSGCNLRIKGEGLIQVAHPASKCTDSYIVTPEAAKKMHKTMSESIDLAIDWELNYQMFFHNLRVFWLEPPVVRQGSQDGTWCSSISNKKENLFK